MWPQDGRDVWVGRSGRSGKVLAQGGFEPPTPRFSDTDKVSLASDRYWVQVLEFGQKDASSGFCMASLDGSHTFSFGRTAFPLHSDYARFSGVCNAETQEERALSSIYA